MSDSVSWDEDTSDFTMVFAPVANSEEDCFPDEDDRERSQESTGKSEPLWSGMSVTLLHAGIGEIGHASVVEVHPSGQWLGLDIPFSSKEFILLRLTSCITKAMDLQLSPVQRGYEIVVQALHRTVLWNATQVTITVLKIPSGDSAFIPRERWVGLEVQWNDQLGAI